MMKQCGVLCLLAVFAGGSVLADEAAITKSLSEYVAVINAKDAAKVGSFWTENGTHTDRETGLRLEGRDAIVADITQVLQSAGEMKLSAQMKAIKMVTANVARVDGETTLVTPDAAPVVSAFTALLVKDGDKWLLDSIEEMPTPQPASTAEALQNLEWLVGDWVDESDDVTVNTRFRWTDNKAFMLRSFSVETKTGVELTGTQIIGWDPRSEQIRGWTFNSNGSFGESNWSRNGASWLSKSTQTTADGRVASGTYVMEKLDNDSFSMQLVGLEVDGAPQPGGPAVKIVRVKSDVAETSGN